MKLKSILGTALVFGVVAAQAVTNPATSTNSPSTSAGSPDALTALFGDPVVAKGDGFAIKHSEVDQIASAARARAAAAGQSVPSTLDAAVLDRLITIQLLLQKATDADRAEGKKESDEQYQFMLKQYGSEEALQRQLTVAGMTVEQLRTKATQEATANAVLKRELNVSVSDADAQAYYASNAPDFEVPEMVRAQHILLLTIDPATRQPLATNVIAEKRKQIEDIRKRALAGEDFTALVKKYSEDPGAKVNDGEYTFARGQMQPEFEAAAFALQTNQISDVVKTIYGFHIIKLLEKKPAKKLTLADKVPSGTVTVNEYIKTRLTQLKIAKLAPAYINQLRAAAHVQILDDKLKAQDELLQAAVTNSAAPDGGQ